MKVAQLTQHYRPIVGGQEVYIANLLKVLISEGIDSRVFQPNRGIHANDIVNVFRIKGLPRFITGSEPYIFNLALRMTKLGSLRSYDVIIAHYAILSMGLNGFASKTIILSHGVEWHTENMNLDDRLHEWIARRQFNKFTHVVNDTHYLRHLGIDHKPGVGAFTEVAPGKWFIPNCVDSRHFVRTEGISRLKERNIILVPRQICADRGIDLALRSFKLFKSEFPDFTLLILGKQRPGSYLDYIRKLIIELDISDDVLMEDAIPNDQMPDYYSSAVMTLIPTLRREGTSLSALESMACGTPTISTNVAGLADLPTVQVDPIPETMAAAMISTLARRDEVASRQQLEVIKTFNFTNWARAWLEVVHRVGSSYQAE